MNLLSMSKQQILMMLIARVIIILLVLPLHEFAHAWVARLCGDDTADSKGRLTLNPFSHVDPFGAILLLLTGFGWAKPFPSIRTVCEILALVSSGHLWLGLLPTC